MKMKSPQYGSLAAGSGQRLELKVLESANGFYLGTFDDEGPYSRESMEYFPSKEVAERALATGDWHQRDNP